MMKNLPVDITDIDKEILLICAFRYALGRQSYVVGAICKILIMNWDNFPKERRQFFKNEIREAIDANKAGDKHIDVPSWKEILRLGD